MMDWQTTRQVCSRSHVERRRLILQGAGIPGSEQLAKCLCAIIFTSPAAIGSQADVFAKSTLNRQTAPNVGGQNDDI